MRTEIVEVYSDASNASIIRHSERRFPGMLIQGDTLRNLSAMATAALAAAVPDSEQYYELKALADDLQGRVSLYVRVMNEHGLELPFVRSEERDARDDADRGGEEMKGRT